MLPISDLTLGEVMDRDVLAVPQGCTLDAMIERMKARHISHVVVLDGNTPVGIFTERDLVRLLHGRVDMQQSVDDAMSRPVVTVISSLRFRAAYVQLCLSRLRHLIVVDANGHLVGVAAERDFLGHLGMELCQSVQNLRALVDWFVPHLPSSMPVTDAINRMVLEKRGCVIVVEDGNPVGIFTEHQAPTILARHADGSATTLSEVMHRNSRLIGEDVSVADAISQLVMERIGYLVMVHGNSSGVIAQSSLLENVRSTINAEVASRQLIEDQIVASERRLQATLESASNVGIQWYDAAGRVKYWNRASEIIYGWTAAEALGRTLDQLIFSRAECAGFTADLEKIAKSAEVCGPFEMKTRNRDGDIRWIEATVFSIPGESHDELIFVRIDVDITRRKQAEQELQISATAFEAQEGMMICDADNVILKVNPAFTRITGYKAEEVVGERPNILSSGRHNARFYADMWSAIHQTGIWKGEIWNRRKSGEIYPEFLNISAVRDGAGGVINYVCSFSDITQQKAAEEEINTLNFYDPLTQLPNRRLLQERIRLAMAASVRRARYGALLFIDLDDFKSLNDTLGHDVGDLLLKQVAQRLLSSVRDGDTVARLGGDEFVVMLEELSAKEIEAAEQAEISGAKILARLNQPYQLGEQEYISTPSIGASLFLGHQKSTDELMRQADIAMYQAKSSGRNAMRFFDPKMQEAINARVSLEGEMRRALEKRQFELYYQIQVDDKGRSLGAEALIRWAHPEMGMVSPAQFIPMAEETGLIIPIGLWVLESACAQLKRWAACAATRELVLSINVSALQFRQDDFAAQVVSAAARHGISPAQLKLELTESVLQDSIEKTIVTMNELNETGVRFSLDDFGTGYSSLQYLKRLPLDQLKIDQSFVRDIASDPSDKAIVGTIITMAHSLNLDVIAEGVETEEQRRLLLEMGCLHYQGYLFGRPVPIAQFDELFVSKIDEPNALF